MTSVTMRSVGCLALAGVVATAAACGASPSEAEPEGATVEHAMGSTTLDESPRRVVALDPSYIDAVLLLDAELAGYVQYRADPDNPFPAYLGDVSAETEDSTYVGTMAEPDLETILEIQPDLIISATVRHEALYDQLSQIAPTVMSETTGPTWKQNVLLLGESLGERERAEALVADYEARAASVGQEILAARPDLTYSFLRFAGEDTARLYSTTSFIGEIMADMGIRRPDAAPDTDENIFVPLSAEEIADADAGLIMVSAYQPPGEEGEASRAQLEAFESNPLWDRLQGDVLAVDDEAFALSVSVQGAHGVITDLAEHVGVDPQSP